MTTYHFAAVIEKDEDGYYAFVLNYRVLLQRRHL